MVAGGAAGAAASALTTPLDVCKTLLNTQEDGAGKTRGLLQAAKKIYRTAGPLGFFKGLQARVLYQMPATAICWSTYEFFKYILTGTANRGGSGGGSRAGSSDIVATADLVKDEKKLSDLRYVLPVSSASAEASSSMIVRSGTSSSSSSSTPAGSSSSSGDCGRRELPAMSGAGIYGAMSFNTMHSNTAADHHQLRRPTN